jgi:hypothetical protein
MNHSKSDAKEYAQNQIPGTKWLISSGFFETLNLQI